MTKFRIVIADDDVDDFFIIRQAFEELRHNHIIEHVKDGRQLLDHISFASPLPDLILLDIHMPVVDGIKALELIQKDKFLSGIPVVIYSTSRCPDQKRRCEQLGANAFVTKAYSYKKVLLFVRGLHDFLSRASAIPGCHFIHQNVIQGL